MSSFRLEEIAAIESVAMPPRKRRAQKSEVRKVEVTGHVGGRSQPDDLEVEQDTGSRSTG